MTRIILGRNDYIERKLFENTHSALLKGVQIVGDSGLGIDINREREKDYEFLERLQKKLREEGYDVEVQNSIFQTAFSKERSGIDIFGILSPSGSDYIKEFKDDELRVRTDQIDPLLGLRSQVEGVKLFGVYDFELPIKMVGELEETQKFPAFQRGRNINNLSYRIQREVLGENS